MRTKWKSWVKEILIMAAIFAAVMFVMRTIRLEGQRGGGGDLPVGSAAPSFSLPDARTGEPWNSEALVGAPAILVFWGTYCPACREELPALETVSREAGGRYRVVTLSAEDPQQMQRFLAGRQLDFPVLMDASGKTFGAYHVDSVPKTVILDARGAIVHDFVGTADLDVLRDHMAQLVGG